MGEILIPVSKDEFEKAGSKFVTAGTHPIECTSCGWKTEGKSLAWSVIVTEEGSDKDKEAQLFTGIGKDALFKTKAVLNAFDIPYKFGKNGVSFDPSAAAGKTATGLWTVAKDERTPGEGGKGTTYTKLTDILPEGSKIEG